MSPPFFLLWSEQFTLDPVITHVLYMTFDAIILNVNTTHKISKNE